MKILVSMVLLCLPAFSQQADYPLHIGDMWQYRYFTLPYVDTTVYTYRVDRDTVIGERTYAVIVGTNGWITGIVRQQGDSVFVFRPDFGKEVLYYDFSQAAGDTVSSTPYSTDTMDIVLTDQTLGSYFGKAGRMWVFGVNQGRQMIDDEYSVIIADSLGVVQVTPGFGDKQNLVGAIINGKTYGIIVGVNKDDKSTPEQFTLLQNYPNPFNPSTTIRFSVPSKSRVCLSIYNVLGQRVAELANEEMGAGSFERTWNTNVASGLYFYRFEAVSVTDPNKRFVEVKKMVLLK